MPTDDPFNRQPPNPPHVVPPSFDDPANGNGPGVFVVEVVPVPRPPHPGFWWSLLWWPGFLLITQLLPTFPVLAVVVVVEAVSAGGWEEFLDQISTREGFDQLKATAFPPLALVIQVTGISFSCLMLRLIVGKDWTRRVALRRPAICHLVLVTIGLPAMITLGEAVAYLANQFLPSFKQLGLPDIQDTMKLVSEWPVWFAVLCIGVGPGIGEELWCRGFLGRGLVGHYGLVAGVLLTSLFFGLLHVDPPHAVTAFAMGLVLHFTYLTTRSLWVPIMLHFLNNALAVVATSKQVTVPALDALDQFAKQEPAPFLLAAGFLLAAVGWALYQSRARLLAPLDPWQPAYPGVEYPPVDSGTAVVHPWPGLGATLLVVLAFVLFLATVAWGIQRS